MIRPKWPHPSRKQTHQFGMGSWPFTPDHVFGFAILKYFLVAILTSLVFSASPELVSMQNEREKALTLNPLSPHDALKHHFTSLKTDLIFPKTRGFRINFP